MNRLTLWALGWLLSFLVERERRLLAKGTRTYLGWNRYSLVSEVRPRAPVTPDMGYEAALPFL